LANAQTGRLDQRFDLGVGLIDRLESLAICPFANGVL
jgi:hypothetical protein